MAVTLDVHISPLVLDCLFQVAHSLPFCSCGCCSLETVWNICAPRWRFAYTHFDTLSVCMLQQPDNGSYHDDRIADRLILEKHPSVGWTIYHALEYLILGPTTDSLSSALLQQQILSIMAFLFIETFFYIIKFTETFCMPAQPFSSRLESLENLSRIQGCICIISQSFVKDSFATILLFE